MKAFGNLSAGDDWVRKLGDATGSNQKQLLCAAGLAGVTFAAALILIGGIATQNIRAQSADEPSLSFEVASVKMSHGVSP
jgi:hypothetical protein